MTSVLVLFGLISLVWVAYVVRPLVVGRVEMSRGDLRRQLEEEKRGLLVALRDAENDHRLGKLDSADYHRIRETLEIRAAGVMKELESVGDGSANTLEAALARIRADRVASSSAGAPRVAVPDDTGSDGAAPDRVADEPDHDRAREAPGG